MCLEAKKELHNVKFSMSDTHYCKLHKKTPLRNFYDNAFSLVGNAKISTSIKKKKKKKYILNVSISMFLSVSIYLKNSLSLLYHLLDLKEELMQHQNLVRYVSKTSTTTY